MTDKDPQEPKQKATRPGKKVFDVMRPGKAPASATSRPVIVGHKPQVADDQFVPGPNSRLAGDPDEKRPLLDGAKKVGLAPLSQASDSSPQTDVPAPEAEAPQPEASPSSAPEKRPDEAEPVMPSTPPPSDDVQPETPDTEAPAAPDMTPEVAESEAADPPLPAAPAESQKPADEAAADETQTTPAEDKDQSEPAPPPEEKGAFIKPMTPDDVLAETDAPALEHAVVSHHKTHYAQPWKWVLIFFLMIALALIAINFLIDAEVITTDLDIPHIDLIKN